MYKYLHLLVPGFQNNKGKNKNDAETQCLFLTYLLPSASVWNVRAWFLRERDPEEMGSERRSRAALGGIEKECWGNEWYGNRVGRGLALNDLPLWGLPFLHPCPNSQDNLWLGFWPSVLCLTHFVPCCSPPLSVFRWVTSLVHSPSLRLGNVYP